AAGASGAEPRGAAGRARGGPGGVPGCGVRAGAQHGSDSAVAAGRRSAHAGHRDDRIARRACRNPGALAAEPGRIREGAMTTDDAGLAGRYAFIDAVPDTLLDAVVANAHGRLRPRSEAIVVLRDALLAGRLPPPEQLSWPDPALQRPLLDALEHSGVVA